MKLTALNKSRSLVQMVVDQVLTYIAAGKLKPGDILPVESKLAKNLNIGTSTIREALRILETKGIVEILPRKGVSIRAASENILEEDGLEFKLKLSRKHLSDLLESWFTHIVVISDLACHKRTPKDLENLNNILHRIEICIGVFKENENDPEINQKYIDEYVKFFLALAVAAHNIIFVNLMKAMMANLNEYLPLSQFSATQGIEGIRRFYQLGKELLSAIETSERSKTNETGLHLVEELKKIMQMPQRGLDVQVGKDQVAETVDMDYFLNFKTIKKK